MTLGDIEFVDAGYALETTNNRMELQAAFAGLFSLPRQPLEITLYSDSRYVVDGINSYSQRWEYWDGCYRKVSGDAVKNSDIWEPLLQETRELRSHGARLCVEWVKGHSGVPENEQADKLSRYMADRARKLRRG